MACGHHPNWLVFSYDLLVVRIHHPHSLHHLNQLMVELIGGLGPGILDSWDSHYERYCLVTWVCLLEFGTTKPTPKPPNLPLVDWNPIQKKQSFSDSTCIQALLHQHVLPKLKQQLPPTWKQGETKFVEEFGGMKMYVFIDFPINNGQSMKSWHSKKKTLNWARISGNQQYDLCLTGV